MFYWLVLSLYYSILILDYYMGRPFNCLWNPFTKVKKRWATLGVKIEASGKNWGQWAKSVGKIEASGQIWSAKLFLVLYETSYKVTFFVCIDCCVRFAVTPCVNLSRTNFDVSVFLCVCFWFYCALSEFLIGLNISTSLL